MEHHIAVSMRAFEGNARDILRHVVDCGAQRVQIDSLHTDFEGLSTSGRRDLAGSIRRLGLHCSGVDFLIPPGAWEENPEQTLQSFSDAVALAESLGNVPVGTRFPAESEGASSAVAMGHHAGVLVSTHATTPPDDPQIGWYLPLTLLAKEEKPMKTLVEASHGPMAVRLRGDIVGETMLETDGNQVELRELRGVLDAMHWHPIPIVDAVREKATSLMDAWQVAGPW